MNATLTSKAFWQRAFVAAIESGCTPIEAESRAELSLKLHDRRWPMPREITDHPNATNHGSSQA